MKIFKTVFMIIVTVLIGLGIYLIFEHYITPTTLTPIPGSNTIIYEAEANEYYYLKATRPFSISASSTHYFLIVEVDEKENSKTLHHSICENSVCQFRAEFLPSVDYFITETKGAVILVITAPPETIFGIHTIGAVNFFMGVVILLSICVWIIIYIFINSVIE
jgi:hypothetical protein